MTDLTKLRAEMRAGLEGVTSGPWCYDNYLATPGDMPEGWFGIYEMFEDDPPILTTTMEGNAEAIVKHIARCSPDNIRALLDALDAEERYRTENDYIILDLDAKLSGAEHERDEARRERDEARAALEKAEEWNRLRAEDIMTLGKMVGEARAKALEEAATFVENGQSKVYSESVNGAFKVMAFAIRQMKDREALSPNNNQEWSAWKGGGPPPAFWFAVNPETGAETKIYRSYEDFVED